MALAFTTAPPIAASGPAQPRGETAIVKSSRARSAAAGGRRVGGAVRRASLDGCRPARWGTAAPAAMQAHAQPQKARQAPTQLGTQRRLSAEQEAALAAAAAAGDHNAAAALAHANRPLVSYLAARHVGRGLAREDLVAEGLLALERAAQRWRPGAASFGTFAAVAINNAMSRAIKQQARVVRIPEHHFSDMSALRRAMAELGDELGRKPECAEIAARCGFSVEHTLHLMRAMQQATQQQAPRFEAAGQRDGAPPPYEVASEDEDGGGPADAEERLRLLREELEARLAQLGPKQARIVALRHGLADGQPWSFKDIAEDMQLSTAWVSAQYKVASQRLQRQASGGGVAGDPTAASASQALLAAIARLSMEEQLALALRWGWLDPGRAGPAGWSYAAIGRRMNASTTWASSLCKQAERALQAALPPALAFTPKRLESVRLSERQRGEYRQRLQQLYGDGRPASGSAAAASELHSTMQAIAQGAGAPQQLSAAAVAGRASRGA